MQSNEAELIALVSDADAVISQYAPLTPKVIAAMKRAKAIVRYGIGVDNVNLAAAREHGIPVCNIPDYCMDEVADHTLALLLAITRQIVTDTNYIRGGNWGLPVPFTAMSALSQLHVGIVGLGRIGRSGGPPAQSVQLQDLGLRSAARRLRHPRAGLSSGHARRSAWSSRTSSRCTSPRPTRRAKSSTPPGSPSSSRVRS